MKIINKTDLIYERELFIKAFNWWWGNPQRPKVTIYTQNTHPAVAHDKQHISVKRMIVSYLVGKKIRLVRGVQLKNGNHLDLRQSNIILPKLDNVIESPGEMTKAYKLAYGAWV